MAVQHDAHLQTQLCSTATSTSPKPPSAKAQDDSHHTSSRPSTSPSHIVNSDISQLISFAPSPSLQLPSFFDTLVTDDRATGMSAAPRFSNEHASQRSTFIFDRQRPTASATSSNAASSATSVSPHVSVHLPQKPSPAVSPANFRPSPHQRPTSVSGVYHSKGDGHSYSTTSLSTEKSFFDDGPSPKGAFLKSGRSRFNLLNPMNLLARRRSSQNQLPKPEEVGLSINTLAIPALPDNYDPRIRGKIFHDFSAPRPRRYNSYNDFSSPENSPNAESGPTFRNERRSSDLPGVAGISESRFIPSPKHFPLFKEHFNDDKKTLQPESTGYLHAFAVSSQLHLVEDVGKVPAFAKKLPLRIPEDIEPAEQNPEGLSPPRCRGKAVMPLASLSVQETAEGTIDIPKPQTTESPSKSEVSPQLDDLRSVALPKHMTSSSSRFSFQLNDLGSAAQERLLEEKHKQQEASKKLGPSAETGEEDEEDGGDFDFEDADAEGFEEKIPGVNADPETEPEDSPLSQNLGNFHFSPTSKVLSPLVSPRPSQPTSVDNSREVVGLTDMKDSAVTQHAPQSPQPDPKTLEELSVLAKSSLASDSAHDSPERLDSFQTIPEATVEQFNDDDMYFDDGNFDDVIEAGEGQPFDEAIFDDHADRIRGIPAQNVRNMEAVQQRRLSSDSETLGSERARTPIPPDPIGDVIARPSPFLTLGRLETSQHLSAPCDRPSEAYAKIAVAPPQLAGLTETNLAAYHDALVSAANDAAAKGRFDCNDSNSQASEDRMSRSLMNGSQPGLISDDSHISHAVEPIGIEYDLEDLASDSNLDDDLMIAEANAEVLENDDDGFYGQEFGFYARAHGKGSRELVNGGYFSPRGLDDIKRSHSAKNNFQEPSLTPITERSEWSTRNSVASLQIPHLPQSAQSMPSPGIARLLEWEDTPFDDDMSMSALMKLRRGWGGSQTSLHSSLGGSHTSSSPLGYTGSKDLGLLSTGIEYGHRMNSSMSSLTSSAGIPDGVPESEEEGDDDDASSPPLTQTQNTPRKQLLDPRPVTPPDLAPLASALGEKNKAHHSRSTSGAESVSYVRDPKGSGGWVLERRRTGDDGELEVVGREYLAGARI